MKMKIYASYGLCGLASIILGGCIRPQLYHVTPAASTVAIQFPDEAQKGRKNEVVYFRKALAYESYIELDAGGQLFDPGQVRLAQNLIYNLKHRNGSATEQKVLLFLFVHGWKNNASEESGNVWGFRRILDYQAAEQAAQGVPVIGIYIGWPGDSTRFGKFFSFWNRESVADAVGAGDLDGVLTDLLTAVKGKDYMPPADTDASTAVLIGHSFGGLVLERAVIRILRQELTAHPGRQDIPAPADLILLLNEAGPARQARPLLLELLQDKMEYTDANGDKYPLLVAMTSDGDAATKLAFPGGEFISADRPKTLQYTPADPFGQKDSLAYNLLSPANMMGLRSHRIMPVPRTKDCFVYSTPHKQGYCVERIPDPKEGPPIPNTTPYWIMGLPQVFVPDHSSVFRPELLQLVDDFVQRQLGTAAVAPPPPGRGRGGFMIQAAPQSVPVAGQPRLMLHKGAR